MPNMSVPAANPATPGTTASQTQSIAQMQAANDQIRAGVLASSIRVKQSIYSATIVPATTPTVQIPFRNVGLVQGFIVRVDATLANSGGSAAAYTNWNLANLFSNITLFDMDNYQRINCAGWFLNMLGTAREGFPHGAALLGTAFDSPVKYGSNFGVLSAPTLGASPATVNVRMYFYVPVSYSANDLRGAIWAGVVNATAYLQLTFNPTPGYTSGDPTLAVAGGTGTGVTITSATLNVYQVYLDQVPRIPPGQPNAGAPILPPLDLATQYMLNTTSLTGVSAAQDFPVPFSNFRQFLSLGIIYDQAGTVNPGTDVNYFALAAANTYVPFKLDPITQAWLERHKIITDYPSGAYNFDFRSQPIATNQTGNMQLLLNAITAAGGSQVLAGFEAFALTNNVLGAASLPAS